MYLFCSTYITVVCELETLSILKYITLSLQETDTQTKQKSVL